MHAMLYMIFTILRKFGIYFWTHGNYGVLKLLEKSQKKFLFNFLIRNAVLLNLLNFSPAAGLSGL